MCRALRFGLPASCVFGLALLVCLSAAAEPQTGEASDCAMCHEQLTQAFQATPHGRLQPFETLDGNTGCVTCHGDGSEHIDAGGDPEKIRLLNATTPIDEVQATCRACHRSDSLHDWQGSTHALSDVTCIDCHTVHLRSDKGATRPDDPGRCVTCHSEVQAQLQYPSHHPVREGHMNCSSCHNAHGSSIGLVRDDERPEELCFSCHTHLQGPFVFEHEPISEGCDSCHTPHGSVANNLLVQNEPFVCLQCHEMHFHAGLEGEEDPEVRIPRYDPSNPLGTATDVNDNSYPGGLVPNPFGESGYKRAFTTKCTQCHTHVHGSDLPSQSISNGGRGLMR